MNISILRAARLPSSCRKPALFKKACLEALGKKSSLRGELNLIFMTNPEIRDINRRYLGHDYDTDVIAFPWEKSLPSAPSGTGPFGDVFISVDQARIQAGDLGHPLMTELLTLAIHGTLHLVGYDDHSLRDRKRMFSRQDKILRTLGVPQESSVQAP